MRSVITRRNPERQYPELTKKYETEFGLHPYVAEVLASRVGEDEVHGFMYPDLRNLHSPSLFRDMYAAVELIHKAVRGNRPICIFGDYDVDGICGSAILYRTLKKMASDVRIYIPERNSDGYGITPEAAEKLAGEDPGLIVSVDCGSSDREAVSIFREKGIDTIITDHHICTGDVGADAFINPKRPDDGYPFSELCGAGVAFKLACALSGRSAFNLIDLAALATVADMVPLMGENRIIAAKGMYKIKHAPDPSIKALLDTIGIDNRTISSDQISFSVAPRINAAGRIESPMTAFELFRDGGADTDTLRSISAELCSMNQKRQAIQKGMLAQAESMVDKDTGNSIIIRDVSWEPGLLGLTASKLVGEYGVPVVMLSRKSGQWIGSARSAGSVNIHEVLSKFSDMFSRFGGHSMAAGLTVRDECIDRFTDGFTDYMNANFKPDSFVRNDYYDIEAEVNCISMDLIKDMAVLEPFGTDNPQIRYLIRDVEILNKRPIGGGSHSRFTVKQKGSTIGCVAFGRDAGEIPEKCDILGTLGINSYNGNIELYAEAFARDLVEF